MHSSFNVSLTLRSTSVSRGLQVEEQDLIQFSSQQYRLQVENTSSSHSSSSGGNNHSTMVKLLPPSNNNNNNNVGKAQNVSGEKTGEDMDESKEGNDKKPQPPEYMDGGHKGLKGNAGSEDDIGVGEGADEDAINEDEEDEDEEETGSARTADEQMDYLESLEPCPCYAKCCLDSIITLFSVTLLG